MGISKECVSKPCSRRPVHSLTYFQTNILIDHNGRACLADFSLLTIVSDQSTVNSSRIEGRTVHWMSPELIDPESFDLEKTSPTKESDCYALGMVIYEVLSGRAPFAPWRTPLVIQKVLRGERPGRPQGEGGVLFTDDIWRMLELCWKHKPDERASAKAVLSCLQGTSSPLWPSPDVGGIVEVDADGQSDATASDSSMFSVSSHVLQVHSNRPHGTVGPQNTRSGNGLLVPSGSLRRRATTASSTRPSPRSNLYAHPNSPLGVTGLPAPSRGYPPGTTIPPDGGGPPIPPRQDRSEGWVGRGARNVRDIFRAIARGLCGL